jgi:hypothetical protein
MNLRALPVVNSLLRAKGKVSINFTHAVQKPVSRPFLGQNAV